jgi:hypothetical protein
MKRLIVAVGLLGLVFTAVTAAPARADFAVIRFGDGTCKVWWDSADNPAGAGWTKIAIGLPDREMAWQALNAAAAQNVCW